MDVVIVIIFFKVRSKHFSQKNLVLKNLGQNIFDPKKFWSKKFLVQKNLGCSKIIKVKKSLIQKIFGTTNFLVQQILLRQKSKNILYKIFWSKNIWVKKSFVQEKGWSKKIKVTKICVHKVWSKLGQGLCVKSKQAL